MAYVKYLVNKAEEVIRKAGLLFRSLFLPDDDISPGSPLLDLHDLVNSEGFIILRTEIGRANLV